MKSTAERRGYIPDGEVPSKDDRSKLHVLLSGNAQVDSKQKPQGEAGRTIFISNRLPIDVKQDDKGGLEVKGGAGGLVVVTKPVALGLSREGQDVRWVGWPGTFNVDQRVQDEVGKFGAKDPANKKEGQPDGEIKYSPISFTKEEFGPFYEGFSNGLLWGVNHLPENPTQRDLETVNLAAQRQYPDYLHANKKYAQHTDRAVGGIRSKDEIPVQDYQLFGLGRELSKIADSRFVHPRIGFQLHTPFSTVSNLARLDPAVRTDLLKSMTYYDLLGTQRASDADRILRAMTTYLPEAQVNVNSHGTFLDYHGRKTRVAPHLVAVDPDDMLSHAGDPAKRGEINEKRQELAERHGDRDTIMTMGRTDHTKGMDKVVEGFGMAIQSPQVRDSGRDPLLVVAAEPSRQHIPQFRRAKEDLDRSVARLKEGEKPGHPVVEYLDKGLQGTDKQAHLEQVKRHVFPSRADGKLVIPEEITAAGIAGGVSDQAIAVSSTAGVVDQYPSIVQIHNPTDVKSVASSVEKLLTMPKEERVRRTDEARQSLTGYTAKHYQEQYFSNLRSMGRESITLRSTSSNNKTADQTPSKKITAQTQSHGMVHA